MGYLQCAVGNTIQQPGTIITGHVLGRWINERKITILTCLRSLADHTGTCNLVRLFVHVAFDTYYLPLTAKGTECTFPPLAAEGLSENGTRLLISENGTTDFSEFLLVPVSVKENS